MISKRTHPMIGRLSDLLVSGGATAPHHRAGFLDVAMTSPRSPLEYRIQSPRNPKNFDIGGVGLGIVAALGREIFPKFAISGVPTKSDPIPVIGSKETDLDSLEEYTYVTNHGPDNKSFTKVYYDRGIARSPAKSPAPVRPAVAGDSILYPTSDFLSSCHLCKKKLQGKDIYMYRGEKGFCSNECRSTHIINDVRKEQCRSEISRSADVSSTSPIFSTGILAI